MAKTYKNTTAQKTTVTRDVIDMENKVNDNVYETLVVLGKRSNQISQEMKAELHGKLDEFATHTDTLEEIFENREQIEISRFYERLPKPHAIAMHELLNDEVYFRNPEDEESEANNEKEA